MTKDKKKKINYFTILKETASEFSNDNAMKLGASLAYYTVFAIGPLLLVLISITGLFIPHERVNALVNGELRGFLGAEASTQILSIINNLQSQTEQARYGGIIGIITLVIAATGIFLEIQSSINYIWGIHAKPKKGWLKLITNRLLSFSLIVGLGFLLIVTLVINAVADALTSKLVQWIGSGEVIMVQGLNYLILFGIITLLFAIIYKVLPDGIITWRDAGRGAAFTGILFLLGKVGIAFYLSKSSLGATYGAAASVIIILSWVYYSAIILYFGAEFTKVYARSCGRRIRPNSTAVLIEKTEVHELPEGHIPVEHTSVDK